MVENGTRRRGDRQTGKLGRSQGCRKKDKEETTPEKKEIKTGKIRTGKIRTRKDGEDAVSPGKEESGNKKRTCHSS